MLKLDSVKSVTFKWNIQGLGLDLILSVHTGNDIHFKNWKK